MSGPSLTDALRETLALFEKPGTPQTTSEITDQLDIGRRSTYDRLRRLVEAGELETKRVGGNGRVWWRPLEEAAGPTDSEDTVQDDGFDSEQFEQLVDAVEEYAIFRLDTEGNVETWNPGAAEIKGYDAEEILGEHFSVFYTDGDCEAGVPEQNLSEARMQESIEDQGWRVREDGSRFWANVTITAIRDDDGTLDGFAKVIRDMTRRREYERTLEGQAERLKRQRDELESELDTIFDRIADGFYALDENLRFLYLNEHAQDTLGLDDSAVGKHFLESVPATDAFEQALNRALDTQEPVIFEDYYDPVDRWYYNAIYPSEKGLSVYFRDITQRKEREARLQKTTSRLEVLFENSPDMIDILDAEGTILDANRRFCDELGYEKEDVLGTPIWEIDQQVDSGDVESLMADFSPDERRKFEGRYERSDGSTIPVEIHLLRLHISGEDRFLAISRDITERKERVQALREAKTQLEAATDAGDVGTWQWYIDEDRLVTGPWFARKFGVDLEAAREGVSLDAFTAQIHEDDRGRVTDKIEAAVASCGEYEAEYRVRNADGELRWVVARGRVECDEDGNPLTFPGALTDITKRKSAELELERRRERLETLNNLYEIVRDITDAVIDQSTRKEIETIACEHLAEAASYESAWIGEVDIASQTVNVRTEAGVNGTLDEMLIPDDQDTGTLGLTGNAIQTGEVQTTKREIQNGGSRPTEGATTEMRDDSRTEHVEKSAVQSIAAIPLVYENTVYGVLNIHARREDAFEGQELAVIGQLGEIIGHTISAAERKQALMSDDVTEIEFFLPDVSESVGLESGIEGTVTFDRAVPVGDGSFLQYGTIDADSIDGLRTMVEHLDHLEKLTILGQQGSTIRFEIQMSDPPITSTIAAHGGHLQQAKIENDEFHLTVHLPPGVETRQVIETVQETYPLIELQSQQQITRENEPIEPVYETLTEDLTDRQQTVLEAAIYSGFFEWPRNATGEDVAESLGIAPPTFSQHLRKAEGKVFRSLFTETSPS